MDLVNKEAEEAVVGALMLDPSMLPSVVSVLGSTGEKFGTYARVVYESILALDTQNLAIDPITVADHLKKRQSPLRNKTLLAYLGEDYVPNLTSNVVTGSVGAYAASVVNSFISRRIMDTADNMRDLVAQHQNEPQFVLDTIEKAIFDLRSEKPSETRSGAALATQFSNFLAKKIADPGYFRGGKSEIVDLDRMIGGFEPCRLYVVAGRPGLGKTQFVTYVATRYALAQNPILFFSLEMSSHQIMGRITALMANVDSELITKSPHEMDGEQMASVQEVLGAFAGCQYPLYLSYGSRNVMEMRALAKRVSSQAMCEFGKPLGAVFVDYLQLLPRTPGSTATTRNDEVAAISSSLKRLAMEDELNCPVFLVSQMNRGIENRQEKRPQLSDLRDSGGIEQDADVVAFVHPPLAFASENERERIRNKYEIGWEPLELIVAKNRDGKIGTVCCQIQRATGNIRASAR